MNREITMPLAQDTEMQMLAKAAAEFAAGELIGNRQETDRFPYGPFFTKVLEKAFNLDFLHITLPASVGGMGMNITALCMVLDRLCQEDASLGAIILTHCFAQEILIQAGAEDVLEHRATRADQPENFLIACPLFNNPSEIRHVAVVEEKEGLYYLSGEVAHLALGGVADLALVPAAERGDSSWSFYLVDMKQPRVNISDPVLSLGLRCCPATDATFQKAEARPVGTRGAGHKLFQGAAAKLSVAAAAISCGIMKGAFEEALAYAKEREQGGRKLTGWSEMRKLLADMAVHIEIADMVVAKAGRSVDQEEKGWQQKALAAAIHLQETAVQVTTDGVQVLGGVGYMQDFGQEKRFRDAKHIQACFGLTPLKPIRLLEQIIA